MQSRTINFSKWRIFVLLIKYSFYIGIGVFLIKLGFDGNLFALLIGLIFIGVFGWIGWLTLKRFLGMTPALIIDEHGVTDTSTFWSVGLIKWEEVKSIKTKRFFFIKVVRLNLHEPNVFIKKIASSLKRGGIRWRMLFQQTPVQIDARMLDISYAELAKMFLEIDLDNPVFNDLSKHLID